MRCRLLLGIILSHTSSQTAFYHSLESPRSHRSVWSSSTSQTEDFSHSLGSFGGILTIFFPYNISVRSWGDPECQCAVMLGRQPFIMEVPLRLCSDVQICTDFVADLQHIRSAADVKISRISSNPQWKNLWKPTFTCILLQGWVHTQQKKNLRPVCGNKTSILLRIAHFLWWRKSAACSWLHSGKICYVWMRFWETLFTFIVLVNLAWMWF